jgi:ABC-2 type transport system ATP-binding protein
MLKIVLKNVGWRLGNRDILQEINLEINQGEVVGLLGENGAGKTTLLRLLTGYFQPDSGVIICQGKLGYLAENNPLWNEMRVIEYLTFVSEVKSVLFSQTRSLIKACSLEKVLPVKIASLSLGYKQRVGLAAALVGGPEILVLDEPTTGLDPKEKLKINQIIKKFGQKKIVIFSSHILSEVQTVCSRIIILKKGKVVYDNKINCRINQLNRLFFQKTKN